jgi:hypothetical protein
MATFASNTRNVHKELKESLANTLAVVTQLKKVRDAEPHRQVRPGNAGMEAVKNQGPGDKEQNTLKSAAKDAGKSVATQTPIPTNVEKPDGLLMAILERIQEQLMAEPLEALRAPAKNKPKGKKPRGSADQHESSAAVSFKSADTVGHKPTTPHDARIEESPSADPADDFILVSRKNRKTKPVSPDAPSGRKRLRVPKNQAVIIDNPTGTMSYADMIRTAVRDEKLSDDIITRRAKSDNIILEIPEKDHADNLASAKKSASDTPSQALGSSL